MWLSPGFSAAAELDPASVWKPCGRVWVDGARALGEPEALSPWKLGGSL